jgi:hypothetical protein
MFYLP